MKRVIYLFFAIIMFSMTFAACGNKAKTEADATEATEATAEEATEVPAEVDMTGPEYTSAYVCPMHCKGSGSHEAGTCPTCEMAYVANENAKAAEGDGHEGHDH